MIWRLWYTMDEPVKAVFTSLCITALSNKTKMFQQNEIKTVRGRDKERKSHSRYYHWFGLWRDLITGCRLEVAADYKGRSWLATGNLWRQIIGDLVRFYTTIFISVLYIDWFFLEVFITMVIRCCKYLLLLQFLFFFTVSWIEPQEPSTVFKPRRFKCGSYDLLFFYKERFLKVKEPF